MLSFPTHFRDTNNYNFTIFCFHFNPIINNKQIKFIKHQNPQEKSLIRWDIIWYIESIYIFFFLKQLILGNNDIKKIIQFTLYYIIFHNRIVSRHKNIIFYSHPFLSNNPLN